MTGNSSEDMTRSVEAEARLARAIGRLEAALDARAAQTAGAAQQPALAEELSRLQTENGELRALVGGAADRLDATIVKLKSQMAG